MTRAIKPIEFFWESAVTADVSWGRLSDLIKDEIQERTRSAPKNRRAAVNERAWMNDVMSGWIRSGAAEQLLRVSRTHT